MGRDTVQRIEEEARYHNTPYVEVNNIFNPNERVEKLLYEVLDKVKELKIAVEECRLNIM
jgi:hypothetical protein